MLREKEISNVLQFNHMRNDMNIEFEKKKRDPIKPSVELSVKKQRRAKCHLVVSVRKVM